MIYILVRTSEASEISSIIHSRVQHHYKQAGRDRRSQYEIIFSHLLDVAVPTPFATELPPRNTGQHLDTEQTVQDTSKHTLKQRPNLRK